MVRHPCQFDPRYLPEAGTYELDRGHPLGRTVVAMYLFNTDGRVLRPIDHGPALLVNGGSPVAGGYRLSASGDGAYATATSDVKIKLPLMLALDLTIIGTPTDGAGGFGTAYDNADGSPYYGACLTLGAAPSITLGVNNGGVANFDGPVVSVTRNVPLRVVGIATTGTREVFIDGVKRSRATGTWASPTYSATSSIFAGNYPGVFRASAAVYRSGAIHNGITDPAWLSAEPYAMLRPVIARTYSFASFG